MSCSHQQGSKLDLGICRSCGMQFAKLSLVVNLGLAALKVVVGLWSGSHALLAGALYSINDVLSAVAVVVSLKLASRPATATHPYGHGKAEFIAVGMVSMALAAGVLIIVSYSAFDIGTGGVEAPHFAAMVVALICLVASSMLARRGFCVAEKLDSPALRTSAEHNRADAISSFAVLIGVGGATLGLHALDRFVALFEALHVVALSGALLAKALKGLMDTALPSADLELVDRACRRVPGVTGLAFARSRRAGSEVWLTLGVVVAPELSVHQAHLLGARVQNAVGQVLGPGIRAQVRFQAHDDPQSLARATHA